MSAFGCVTRLVSSLLAAYLLAAAAPASALGAKPAPDARWRVLLADQLKSEKNCDLLEVLNHSEVPLGNAIALSGRASCVDGRLFDFSRTAPHKAFELHVCEPAVC